MDRPTCIRDATAIGIWPHISGAKTGWYGIGRYNPTGGVGSAAKT